MTDIEQQPQQQPQPEQAEQEQQTSSTPVALDQATVEELKNFYVEYQQQKAMSTLKQAWGSDYEQVFAQVESYLSELPPELATQFNNVNGALVLGRLLAGTSIPGLETSTPSVGSGADVAAGKGKFKFTKSELDNLYKNNRKEYQQRRQEIDEAYALGLVDRTR